jgi:hypothetical protein
VRLTDEESARLKEAYGEHIKHLRSADMFANRYNALRAELLITHGAPPGQDFDVWGDGELMAEDKCKLPPGAKRPQR